MKTKSFKPRLGLGWLVVIALTVFLRPAHGHPQESIAPRRVLALYWYNKDFPVNVALDQSFRAVLQSAAQTVEYYPEYLENRLPAEHQAVALRDYLRQKYADIPIDVVVAFGAGTQKFIRAYRNDIFPRTPIVFVGPEVPTTEEHSSEPGITGVVQYNTFRETLGLALELHPNTEQVYVVSGTLERDKRVEASARHQLQGYVSPAQISYLTDFTPSELTERIKALPEHSIILYAWYQSINEQGKLLDSADILDLIAPAAAVPIYGLSGGNLGHGIIGGHLFTPEGNGTRAAEIALRIANGARAQVIQIENAPTVTMFDGRQLQRWKIDDDKLPLGSVIRFREPSFWYSYRWHIAGVLSLCAVQSALIGGLLVERRRRRLAKAALTERLEFETLLSALSAEIANLRGRDIEPAIEKWLHRLRELLGAEGAGLFELPEASATTPEHSNGASPRNETGRQAFVSGTLLGIDQLGHAAKRPLSDESNGSTKAANQRALEQARTDSRPLLRIPLIVDGSKWMLVFSASQTRRVWRAGLLARIRLVGEIFAAAIVRKRGEQALAESKKRYELATSRGKVGVWDWDLRTGEIYVEPLLKAILGYEDHEIRNHLDEWGRLVHPEDADFVSDAAESHIRGDAPLFEVEHRMLHRDGGIRWFLARGHAIRDEQGVAVRMLGTDIDITERKRFVLELEGLSARLLKSQDDERRRLARELHDGTGQNLAAININLFQLRQGLGAGLSENLRDSLDECQMLCEQSLQEIRTLAYILHPPILEQAGLISALKWYVRGFGKRSGIEVDLVVCPDVARLPREIELDLFRIVQECLANVHRHSGSRTAQLRVGRQAEQLILQVQDQGCGIQSEKTDGVGVGVSGMRERLRHLGGRLIISSSDQGTTVTAFLPLAAARASRSSFESEDDELVDDGARV